MSTYEVFFWEIRCEDCGKTETAKVTQRNPDITAFAGRWVNYETHEYQRYSTSKQRKDVCDVCFSKVPVDRVNENRVMVSWKRRHE